MRLRFIFLITLVACGLIGAIGAAGVAADSNETNQSGLDADGDELENATTDSVDESEISQSQSKVRVDDVVSIVDYEWDEDAEVFRIVFESDRAGRQLTISESVQQPEGAGTFSIRRERIDEGLTEVAIPAEPVADEVAVSITTTASIQQETGAYVSTGITEGSGRPAISWDTAQILIGLTALGTGVGITRVVRKKRDEETKEAERWI